MGIPSFDFDSVNGPFIYIISPDGNTTRKLGLTNDGTVTCDGQPLIEQEDTSYEEYTYTGSLLTGRIIWTDNGKTQKIKEEVISYTANRTSQIVTDYYDGSGVKFKTVTEVLSYNNQNQNQLESIDRTVS